MDDDLQGDRPLVAAVLEQRKGAFERLVERHQKLVWHLVFRMVQHPEDTHELSQEIFLRVHRQLEQFRFESALSTWIGRIAFNVAARHLEKKRLPLVEPEAEETGDAPLDRVADDFDLEAVAADSDMMAKMFEALESLPPLSRTLLTLYHLDELSVPEVAAIVEMPVGTVKNYLFRARLHLREKLETLLGVLP